MLKKLPLSFSITFQSAQSQRIPEINLIGCSMTSPKRSANFDGLAEFGSEKMRRGLEENRPQEKAELKERRRAFEASRKAKPKPKTKVSFKPGSFISTAAVDMCIQALQDAGRRRIPDSYLEVIILILGKVLNTKSAFGVGIRNEDYRNRNRVSELKRILAKANLIFCPDWSSWKSGFFPHNPPQAQHFFPTIRLTGAKHLGNRLKPSLADYKSKIFLPTPTKRLRSSLVLHRSPKVPLPRNIQEACVNGTGLYFDYEAAHEAAMKGKWEERDLPLVYWSIVWAIEWSQGEIVPAEWSHKESGMLFSKQPPLQQLRSDLSPYLKSVDGKPLWEVDFKNFYVVLFKGDEAIKKIEKKFDYYEQAAEDINSVLHSSKGAVSFTTRDEVKTPFNAIINGSDYRRPPKKKNWREMRKYEIGKILKTFFPGYFPDDFENSISFRKVRRVKDYWNIRGAEIFLPSLSAGMEEIGLKKIGLPKHDGIIFPATQSEAESFHRAWKEEANRRAGFKVPSKLKPLTRT